MSPDDPRHGTNAGHRAHFTDNTTPCQPCREAHATYRRNLWRKKYLRRVDTLIVPSLGTIRRIRALQAIGWRLSDLDKAMGYSGRSNAMHNLTRQDFVRRDTAEKVAAAYDEMSMTPGPSQRSRNLARKWGWLPPLAWDDIDNDSEPTTGPSEHIYRAPELVAEWDHLRRSGESIEQAARQLGVTVGAIEKALERVAKESAA